jgi:uncharacterized membrane protein
MARQGDPNANSATSRKISRLFPDVEVGGDAGMAYIRAATLGFVSGLRSMTPLALLSWLRRGRNTEPQDGPGSWLGSPALQLVTALLASGELLGDKLPSVPSRLSAGPLASRFIIGALAGMTISRSNRQSPLVGTLLGAAGAGVGSLAGYYVRSTLAKASKIPPWVWGLAEDGLALYLGSFAVKSSERSEEDE